MVKYGRKPLQLESQLNLYDIHESEINWGFLG